MTPQSPTIPAAGKNRVRSAARRLLQALAALAGVLLVGALVASLWLRSRLHACLPQLRGERPVPGLLARVAVERDALGVPLVRGAGRLDVARATGFLHAQERFFQMDLERRGAAGELAEILGAPLLAADRRNRVHRFRALAREVLARSRPEERAVIAAYTEGVNAGLSALGATPFEYLALRAAPAGGGELFGRVAGARRGADTAHAADGGDSAGYGLDPEVLKLAAALAARCGGMVEQHHDPQRLPSPVDCVYTSRWLEMGVAKSDPHWLAKFRPYAVDAAMMAQVSHVGTIFLHDLPAMRGDEVTDEVLDGGQSIAFRQAFHKMTSAMAVLDWCAGKG